MLPAGNWVLDLLQLHANLEETTNTKVTTTDVSSFQEVMAKFFNSDLNNNITSQFSPQDIILAFTILINPNKVPYADSPDLSSNGENSIDVQMKHYGTDMLAETVQGERFTKTLLTSSDSEVHKEWKNYYNFITMKPEEDKQAQLKQLTSSKMLVTVFPNLNTPSIIHLSIPVATASVKQSFSLMKLIKTRLKICVGERSLSNLMKIHQKNSQIMTSMTLLMYGIESLEE